MSLGWGGRAASTMPCELWPARPSFPRSRRAAQVSTSPSPSEAVQPARSPPPCAPCWNCSTRFPGTTSSTSDPGPGGRPHPCVRGCPRQCATGTRRPTGTRRGPGVPGRRGDDRGPEASRSRAGCAGQPARVVPLRPACQPTRSPLSADRDRPSVVVTAATRVFVSRGSFLIAVNRTDRPRPWCARQ